MRTQSRRHGFSLTELLVVVAVILILAALLMVGVDALYSHTAQLRCQHRLEQIGHACQMYASTHQGALPESVSRYGLPWYEALVGAGYLDTNEVISCPSAESELVAVVDPGETASDILEGLRWLKRNQNTGSGGWDWDGASTAAADDAVSGLALYAFLTAGCTDQQPPEFALTVESATQYLISKSDNGAFYRGGSVCMYTTGICTMALAEAARMTENESLREAARETAEEGIAYMASRQSTSVGGWSYGGGGHDISVTGWCLEGYAQAMASGIDIPANAQTNINTFLRASIREDRYHCNRVYCSKAGCGWGTTVTDHNTWLAYVIDLTLKCPNCGERVYACWIAGSEFRDGDKCPSCGGNTTPYPPSEYGTGYAYAAWYAKPFLAGTAIALACRRLMGESMSSAACQGALQVLSGLNYMNNANGTYYNVYYLTLVMSQMDDSRWNAWNEAFRPAMLERQIKDGEDMGSWPINNYWSAVRGGRVYTTAMACITLERCVVHHWAKRLAVGQCSYGYNNRLGKTRERTSADTIVVMDYAKWEIDRDDKNVEYNDDIGHIAARHGGKANALLGDGHVRAFEPDDITDGMWTPEPGD